MIMHRDEPISRGRLGRKTQPLVVVGGKIRSYPLIPRPYYYDGYNPYISNMGNKSTPSLITVES